jgi:zinc transporter ZupT
MKGFPVFLVALVLFYAVAITQSVPFALAFAAAGLLYLGSAVPRRRNSGVKRTRGSRS